jgi:hypothetical protein
MSGAVWRERHRLMVLLAVVPLSVTVLSAVLYRVLHSVFGVERSAVRWMISVHQGTYFGIDAVVYTFVIKKKKKKKKKKIKSIDLLLLFFKVCSTVC